MQIDFKALEQALAPIEEIGQGELTFDAGSTTITLRVLLPHEEVEAQKFAAQALNEADEGEHSAVDYLDRFRLGILSHAVIAVGDQNFRDAEFIETGETLANGAKVKIPRYKAMRQLLTRWSRSTMTACYAKFSELVTEKEREAEEAIEYEPSSIPAEIDRLNQRISELRSQMEQEEAAEKTKFSEKLAEMTPATDVPVPPPQPEPERDPDEPEVNPSQAMSPVHRQGPISPAAVPPPQASSIEQPTAAPPRPRVPQPADSSFINDEDDDAMNAALDAEHQRIMERRRRAAAGETPMNEGSALQTVHPQLSGGRPPHMDAREVEEDVGLLNARAEHLGEMDGKPVFKMPDQELGTSTRQRPAAPPRAALNPTVVGESNPRFRGPKKP
jgi:hypothetical protein